MNPKEVKQTVLVLQKNITNLKIYIKLSSLKPCGKMISINLYKGSLYEKKDLIFMPGGRDLE